MVNRGGRPVLLFISHMSSLPSTVVNSGIVLLFKLYAFKLRQGKAANSWRLCLCMRSKQDKRRGENRGE
jgi:hypothetical protein